MIRMRLRGQNFKKSIFGPKNINRRKIIAFTTFKSVNFNVFLLKFAQYLLFPWCLHMLRGTSSSNYHKIQMLIIYYHISITIISFKFR